MKLLGLDADKSVHPPHLQLDQVRVAVAIGPIIPEGHDAEPSPEPRRADKISQEFTILESELALCLKSCSF